VEQKLQMPAGLFFAKKTYIVLTEKKLTTKRKKLKTLKKLALVSKENSLYQDENYSE